MKKYKYVDINAYSREGHDSSIMINSDRKFLTKDGVIEVSKERWQEAQDYEALEWMQRNLGLKEDRNDYHRVMFEDYSSVKGMKFESMIELGCGPFTNAKIICRLLDVERTTLLDPLIDQYLKHPNCSYKQGLINDKKINLINSSIEELDTSIKYDLVVMLNVLEHCRSIPKVFDKVQKILKSGGFFIFSDVFFSENVISDLTEYTYNAGHPIRIEEKYLMNFLSSFQTQYSKIIEETVADRKANEIYFIGRIQ